MNKSKISKEIIDNIIADICDRGGLQNAWEEIDDDVQNDIKQEWEVIILNALDNK